MEESLKSVFSFMDFRHNVVTKEDSEKLMEGLLKKPKNFLYHDDGTRFVVSKNKDIKLVDVKDN